MSNKVAKWEKWIDVITGDCANLLLSKEMFGDLHQMIAKNERMRQADYFHEYMENTYVAHVLMMLRKHLKVGADSISLVGLAEDMLLNPSAIPDPAFAGEIQKQLHAFKASAAKVESFADRVVAHRDKRMPSYTPTFKDVDGAIDDMDKLCIECSSALNVVCGDTCKPTVQYGWLTIFRDMGIET